MQFSSKLTFATYKFRQIPAPQEGIDKSGQFIDGELPHQRVDCSKF